MAPIETLQISAFQISGKAAGLGWGWRAVAADWMDADWMDMGSRQTAGMGRTGWLLAWAEWMLGWMIWGTGDGGLDGDWMDDDWKGECQIDL